MINDNTILTALHEGKRIAFAQVIDMIHILYRDDNLMPDEVVELYKYIWAKVSEERCILNERIITLEKEKADDKRND